jgi:short-subunit dehydrogenase
VLVARREGRLRALAARIGGEYEQCDLADAAALAVMADRVLARHPEIHLLVNNAGIPARGTIAEVPPELIERVMAVNYLAGVRLTRSLLPGLRAGARTGRAHVVNLASVAGTMAFAQGGAYAASKHAQVAFSRALLTALRPERIEVHTILPGFVETEGFPQRTLLAHPVGRRIVVPPSRVARAIAGAVERGRAEVVVPWFPYRLAGVIQGVTPGLAARLARRRIGGSTPRDQSSGLPPQVGDGPVRRVALVTGASSGIGEATARLLAHRGWHCILVARREDRLREIAAEIGGEAEACDVSDRTAVDAMARRVLSNHQTLNLLVNNAGSLARGSFAEVDPDLVERAMAVNYLGGVWATRALLPGLRAAAARDGAHIVNVVSIGGAIVFPPAGPYSAAKHAQLAFSRSLRAMLSGSGIDVHTVLPGFVTTPGFPHPSVFQTWLGRRFVIGPDEAAGAIMSAIERGTAEVVVPWFPYRLGTTTQALFPTLSARVLAKAAYPETTRDSPPSGDRP